MIFSVSCNLFLQCSLDLTDVALCGNEGRNVGRHYEIDRLPHQGLMGYRVCWIVGYPGFWILKMKVWP